MKISDQFYANAVQNTRDGKRIRSLERLKEACESLQNLTKDKPFTIADVGHFCERKWGGPKAQSIRNSPDILEKYVRLFIADSGVRPRPRQKDPARKALNLADPSVAQQQYLLALAEVTELRSENVRLKVDIERYAPLSADELLDSPIQNARSPKTADLLEDAAEAILSLFDVERLKGCELKIDPHGYLINEISGNHLLTAKEVSSLRALVEERNRPIREREARQGGLDTQTCVVIGGLMSD